METAVLQKLATDVASVPIDRDSVPQHALDLENRTRTSVFPWRGQFSPGLIDLMLSLHTKEGSIVVDPFVGSGTTLFEATRKGLECYGGEINPAAAKLASVATLACANKESRQRLLKKLDRMIERELGSHLRRTVFRQGAVEKPRGSFVEAARELVTSQSRDSGEFIVLAASVLMAMGDGSDLLPDDFESAYGRIKVTVESLPYSSNPCEVFLADARQFPIEAGCVDLVITSPPYINVFNYHQNYRKAVELLGWDVLELARSEIGANRKHRQNRLLTVIQYCMDMQLVLTEMHRLLKPGGRAIITIGRESNVRRTSFANGQLLAMLATDGAGFDLETWRERKFINRFGTSIYEDILTLRPRKVASVQSVQFGRSVGVWALREALEAAEGDVAEDLERAILAASSIEPSPIITFPDGVRTSH